jgi:hypothetical protein
MRLLLELKAARPGHKETPTRSSMTWAVSAALNQGGNYAGCGLMSTVVMLDLGIKSVHYNFFMGCWQICFRDNSYRWQLAW